VHWTGFVPTQAPLWQESSCVQASPSLQLEPFAPLLHAVRVTAGWQDWQTLPGAGAFAA
jgi:hypothetical protein